MFKWLKNKKNNQLQKENIQKDNRLEQIKKNTYRRVYSDNMTEIEKMDQGFNGKTFTINGIEVDF